MRLSELCERQVYCGGEIDVAIREEKRRGKMTGFWSLREPEVFNFTFDQGLIAW